MKKNGFTLIELLAVIAVLAIVLLIAIPNIMSAIDETKKGAYHSDEKTLVKSAVNYLAVNPNLVPNNVGDITTISYTSLTASGFVSPILDNTSKNECTNSKVFATKLASGNISYTSGIVCDNYISIDTFDLLKGQGKFALDSNADGLADGVQRATPSTISLTNGVQSFTPTTQYASIGFQFAYTIGDVFYGFGSLKTTNSQYWFQIGDGDSVPSQNVSVPPTNNFEYLTARVVTNASTGSPGIRAMAIGTSGFSIIEIKEFYAFNLTAIYGAGNEPSLAQMNTLIQKSR